MIVCDDAQQEKNTCDSALSDSIDERVTPCPKFTANIRFPKE